MGVRIGGAGADRHAKRRTDEPAAHLGPQREEPARRQDSLAPRLPWTAPLQRELDPFTLDPLRRDSQFNLRAGGRLSRGALTPQDKS